jgi:hypothetical protein
VDLALTNRKIFGSISSRISSTFRKLSSFFTPKSSPAQRTEISREEKTDLHRAIKEEDFDLDSPALLPGFKKTSLDCNKLKDEALVFVHLTNHKPFMGHIKSNYDVDRRARKTTHWSLNHAVKSLTSKGWNKHKFAVLITGDQAFRLNGKPAGGNETDMFFSGIFDADSPGTVILTQDDTVPKNKLRRIIDKSFGSSTLVLASSEYPHDIVQKIIEKMGRDSIKSVPQLFALAWDLALSNPGDLNTVTKKILERVNGFTRYMQSIGVPRFIHYYSPFKKFEDAFHILIHASKLADGTSWEIPEGNAQNFILKDLFEALRDVEHHKLEKHFPCDLNSLVEIIEASKNPKEAVSRIETELALNMKEKPGNLGFDFGIKDLMHEDVPEQVFKMRLERFLQSPAFDLTSFQNFYKLLNRMFTVPISQSLAA